ncbi:MAG: tRNA (adenosine(37)-N6)-threonylcarbamoyltransferase complex dimerization subunit type 1 TsaB [Ferruginibacter sp.]
MSMILNIDTAIDIATVSIAKNGQLIGRLSNAQQKDHGGFLQPAIQRLLRDSALSIHELDAIAISAGPGSYTGLRVGMASAKGLSYALKKPLITINTLEILAWAAISERASAAMTSSGLYCPMIDARRNEVFTAVYDKNLQRVLAPSALILDKDSFAKTLLNSEVVFFGNGSPKWKTLCENISAIFIELLDNHLGMCQLSFRRFQSQSFADLAYSDALYLKEFHDGTGAN